jgi:hypothetical protein
MPYQLSITIICEARAGEALCLLREIPARAKSG